MTPSDLLHRTHGNYYTRILAKRLHALPDMLLYESFGVWFRYHIIKWAALPTVSKMIYWPVLELSIL